MTVQAVTNSSTLSSLWTCAHTEKEGWWRENRRTDGLASCYSSYSAVGQTWLSPLTEPCCLFQMLRSHCRPTFTILKYYFKNNVHFMLKRQAHYALIHSFKYTLEMHSRKGEERTVWEKCQCIIIQTNRK